MLPAGGMWAQSPLRDQGAGWGSVRARPKGAGRSLPYGFFSLLLQPQVSHMGVLQPGVGRLS